ncbi:MAG: TOBE domain-containing protein, partial [Terrimicrobiaceae bacterium]
VSAAATETSVPGTVSVVENLGDETRVGVRYGDVLMMASTGMTKACKPGTKVNLIFVYEDLNLYDRDTGERLTA